MALNDKLRSLTESARKRKQRIAQDTEERKKQAVLSEIETQHQIYAKLNAAYARLTADPDLYENFKYLREHPDISGLPRKLRDVLEADYQKIPEVLTKGATFTGFLFSNSKLVLPIDKRNLGEIVCRVITDKYGDVGSRVGENYIMFDVDSAEGIEEAVADQCGFKPLRIDEVAVPFDLQENTYTKREIMRKLSIAESTFYRLLKRAGLKPSDSYTESNLQALQQSRKTKRRSKYLTVEQAASILELESSGVYYHLSQGALVGEKHKGKWRIPQSSIDQFKADHVRINMVYHKKLKP
jgi:hypothetical protein